MLATFLIFLELKALVPIGCTIGRSLHGLFMSLMAGANPMPWPHPVG